MVAVTDFLGLGLYTPAEAAMYARVSTRMMSRWVHGDAVGDSVVRAQIEDAPDKIVSFLDFVQTLAIRAVREQKKIPLQKIRSAIETAEQAGVSYPLARKHTIYWWVNEIHIDVDGFSLLQGTGKLRGQMAMKPLVEMHLTDLGFDADGLANRYTAYESMGVRIIMRPDYRLGEPVLETSGHTALTLWQACISEGSPQAAAKAYGVTETDVRVAFKYIDSIRPATAA